MDNPETLPLFPLPDEHQAFVRFVELPWPLEGSGYEVVCPACPLGAGLLYETYDAGFTRAYEHREMRGAPIRPADRMEAQDIAEASNHQHELPIASLGVFLGTADA